MNFKLPFPTLKLLTMVHLGKVIFEYILKPRKKLCGYSEYISQLCMIQEDDIAKRLQMAPALRHDFSDVLSGMHYQIVVELGKFQNLEKLEFLFDVHGKLDCPTIWKRYFHSQVSDPAFKPDPLNSLVKLLQFALDQNSWHGIYAILSKISTFYSLNTDCAWLENGKLVLVHGKYAMFYRFSNTLPSRTASHVRSRFQRLFRNSTSIEVRQKGLYLYKVHFDRLFFQDYFKDAQNSMDPEEKFAFLRDTIFDECDDLANMRCAIDILQILDQETARQCFFANLEMYIGEQKSTFFGPLLNQYMKWPLTPLLLPFLEHVEPHLNIGYYECIFYLLVSVHIPERGSFGVYYAEVLEKFWDTIPSHIKQDLRVRGSSLDRHVNNDHIFDFKGNMKLLSEKNSYLYVKVSTDLWPEKSLCE